jgi:hypothetical protein
MPRKARVSRKGEKCVGFAQTSESSDFFFVLRGQIAKGADGADDEHREERFSLPRKRELLQMDWNNHR